MNFYEKYGKLTKEEEDNLSEDERLTFRKLWKEAEEESLNVDLSAYMKLSAEEVHEKLCDFLDDVEWAMLLSGMVSPKGSAYHTALLELRDEKRRLENVQERLKNTKYAYLSDKIVDILEEPTQMATCGCCVEGGGDITVFTSVGVTVFLDRHGTLKEDRNSGFKRLKL